MPIDVRRAEIAVKSGLAFACALCDKHWEGLDRNLQNCGVELCGGPLSMRDFPLYRGPLPHGAWTALCFRCGEGEGLQGFKVVGTSRALAVCKEHRSLLESVNCIFLGTVDVPNRT